MIHAPGYPTSSGPRRRPGPSEPRMTTGDWRSAIIGERGGRASRWAQSGARGPVVLGRGGDPGVPGFAGPRVVPPWTSSSPAADAGPDDPDDYPGENHGPQEV